MGFFCGNGMGMGIEIQFPRQPCLDRYLSQILSEYMCNSDRVMASKFSK